MRFASKMASRFGARQSILTTQLSCDWNSSTNNQLSASDLTLSADFIFEGRQLFGPDGPPRVKLARGDSDLRAKAELAAIEIGRPSCRERVCHTCRSRWSPYHSKKKTSVYKSKKNNN